MQGINMTSVWPVGLTPADWLVPALACFRSGSATSAPTPACRSFWARSTNLDVDPLQIQEIIFS